MNIGAMYAVRKELDAACGLCDTLEEKGLWPLAGKTRLKEVLRMDLARFCMYLTASDGKVNGAEALFFKIALGFDTSIDELIAFIKSENIYSTKFESEVPIIIKTIKGITEILMKAGMDVKDLLNAFSGLYFRTGSTLIECDDEVTEQEKADLNIYMNMVYNYIGGDVEKRIYDGARTNSNVRGAGAERTELRSGKILSNLDFETMRYSGFGNKVVQGVPLPTHAMIVTAKHTGGIHNFMVHYYDCDGNRSRNVANEIGEYYGTTLYDNSNAAPGEGLLEVVADGRWELTFISIPNAIKDEGSSYITGTGDLISPSFVGKNGPCVVKMTHRGKHNFIAHVYDEEGRSQSLVNEIGFFNGEKVVKLQNNTRYFVVVKADGEWSIDFGKGDSSIKVSQITG